MANLLGLKRTALAERKRRNSVPYDELVALSDKKNISLNWLLTGQSIIPREIRQEIEDFLTSPEYIGAEPKGPEYDNAYRQTLNMPEMQELCDKISVFPEEKRREIIATLIQIVNMTGK